MPAHISKAKKERLTLAQLCSYDDILTDALVDQVYYWTKIRKNRSAYHSSRGIREEDVTKILQNSVIVEKNPSKAESQLLALPGLKKFQQNLKTDKEKEDFRRHLKKYIYIYLPDCPFEVSSTNRYTVVTHEASIVARKDINKGEVIKYLCGVQVIMTPEEEAHIGLSRRDFSIVISSRNKTASLFLGPARFANHDCDANARLMTTGSAGMQIIAVRDIDIGDEITVTYGDNYFGEDNCECLCKTCEDGGRNGWAPDDEGDDVSTPKLSIEQETTPGDGPGYMFRRKRRVGSTNSERTDSMTPDVNVRPQLPKRTPRSASSLQARSPTVNSPSLISPRAELKRKRNIESNELSPEKTPKRTRRPRTAVGSPLKMSSTREPSGDLEEESPSSQLQETMRKHLFERSPSRVTRPKLELAPQEFYSGRSRGRPVPWGSLREPGVQKQERRSTQKSIKSPNRLDSQVAVKVEDPSSLSESIHNNLPPPSSASESRRESFSPSSSGEITGDTDATSVDDDTIVVNKKELGVANAAISEPEKPLKARGAWGGRRRGPIWEAEKLARETDNIENVLLVVGKTTRAQHPILQDDQTSILSEIGSDMDFDESAMTIIKKDEPQEKDRRKSKPIVSPTIDLDHAPPVRVPGDYVLTHALLAEPASAWINCKICEEPFVQKDAYFTRASCPRCERHSKLYGYMWPKTDKEGKHDEEERILDHRTVHRFLDPNEERVTRKRFGRGSTGSREPTKEASAVPSEKDQLQGRRSTRSRVRNKRDRFTL